MFHFFFRSIKGLPGFSVGGCNTNNLHYADNTVLIATTEKHLQNILNITAKVKQIGINIKKTEITKKKDVLPCHVKLKGNSLKQDNSFKYLEALVSSGGKSTNDFKSRVVQANKAFSDFNKNLTSRGLSFKSRQKVLHSYVVPIRR